MESEEIGRQLAHRHVAAAVAEPLSEIDQLRSLLNYAEAPHPGDWTLRSALVRLAQPAPAQVGALLGVMRRLDAPLRHGARSLQDHPAWCHRSLAGVDRPETRSQVDIRLADLARVVADGPDPEGDEAAVMAGYHSVTALSPDERMALPLLVVAVSFARLAEVLARWAEAGRADPPLDAVERCGAAALARLDELGVKEEEPPPGRAGGRR